MNKYFQYCGKLCGLALLMVLFLGKAHAWGPIGHRVVGEIATNHLSAKAKKGIAALIGRETLAMISNWPDFIKSDTTNKYSHTSKWHYVDFPGNISRAELERDLKAMKGENLYTQILATTKQLKDPSLSKEKKVEALKWLVHLVGDLHQPLHVGRDEDQGGNKISIFWFDRPSNLHRLWDEHLIEFQQYSYTEYTRILDIASPAQVKAYQGGSVIDWLYESHVLSDKVYARTKDQEKLSYRYNYIFVNDLNNQLLKGGLRLAAILNGIYGE
ncbi:S1/P1 nuclease [Chitinophaga horti]|uniref:S1/P1 nuclease n=1 Tax=Chitinophaga horti TaxID=2920382 RepID=A0ABY6J2Q9_9BACT|nr:S1/P1 nuclease [Chitinophaga horti]UYQ92594.1 S1/P1 nuclease [Chitinophaga horti]